VRKEHLWIVDEARTSDCLSADDVKIIDSHARIDATGILAVIQADKKLMLSLNHLHDVGSLSRIIIVDYERVVCINKLVNEPALN